MERHHETWIHSVLCRDGTRQPAAALTAFLDSSMVARIHSTYPLNGSKKPKKGQKIPRLPQTERGTITGYGKNISCKNSQGWLALPHGVRAPAGADIKPKDVCVDEPSVTTILGFQDHALCYCGSIQPIYLSTGWKISIPDSWFQLSDHKFQTAIHSIRYLNVPLITVALEGQF